MLNAQESAQWSAADFRAERARRGIPIFVIAAKLNVHPGRLGAILNERRPLPPRLAAKIAKALDLPPVPDEMKGNVP